jgi:DUF2075 family protein
MQQSYGWAGKIEELLNINEGQLLTILKNYHQSSLQSPAENSQIVAWTHSFSILKEEFSKLSESYKEVGDFGVIFEYELPRERGRRPDVIILANGIIFVLEFKEYSSIHQSHVDQVSAYARDLKHYHEQSQKHQIIPLLILAKNKDLNTNVDDVKVLSPSKISQVIAPYVPEMLDNNIDLQSWLNSEYSPLPSLVAAARLIFQNEPLPHIKRAQSAGVPQTIENLIQVARQARSNNQLHLAFVTGVPGAGKTLVGIQLVYSSIFGSATEQKDAIFLSGNGPLVKVLQHALKSDVFVQDVHGFLRTYGGDDTTQIPHEHIWVYDEAQRAWDAEMVEKKRHHPISEPEDFLNLAERMNSWVVMVALIGEGQEIHIGEEAGLQQWNETLGKMKKEWIVHCPEKISHFFTSAKTLIHNDSLDLSVTLRSHLAEDISGWVKALLEGDFRFANELAQNIYYQGFDMYLTRDISVAKNYVQERYAGNQDKRYGLLASSKAKNLPRYGIHNEFNYTRNIRVGPWYNDPPTSFYSCCALRDVATEFSCQGLELDFPIICWGDDFRWGDGDWKSPPAKKSHAKDPHRLRLNSYRVLLTRGRDGFIIFLPPDDSLMDTYAMLKMSGVKELLPTIAGDSIIEKSQILCVF